MLLSSNQPFSMNDTPATQLTGKTSMNGSVITKFQTPENGQLAIKKNNSSSVSSNIAEFIPMRSIMKTQETSTASQATKSLENVTSLTQVKMTGPVKRKKVVRFNDMILIGDDADRVQLFLSEEEASIIEKKSTPTKLNMQSCAKLRKQVKQER